MVQKPKIQYIGQFYIHGSEARQLQLEQQRQEYLSRKYLRRDREVYVDWVAIGALAVSVVMVVVMALGALQIYRDWQEYQQMAGYVSQLKQENAEKTRHYHEVFQEDIQDMINALDLVPIAQVEQAVLTVDLPEAKPEVRRIDEIKATLEGLFE